MYSSVFQYLPLLQAYMFLQIYYRWYWSRLVLESLLEFPSTPPDVLQFIAFAINTFGFFHIQSSFLAYQLHSIKFSLLFCGTIQIEILSYSYFILFLESVLTWVGRNCETQSIMQWDLIEMIMQRQTTKHGTLFSHSSKRVLWDKRFAFPMRKLKS